MTESTYTVTGMTCDHCVRAVSAEVKRIPGVSEVEVSLPDGAVKVRSEAPLDEGQLREAVEEAGYELVG